MLEAIDDALATTPAASNIEIARALHERGLGSVHTLRVKVAKARRAKTQAGELKQEEETGAGTEGEEENEPTLSPRPKKLRASKRLRFYDEKSDTYTLFLASMKGPVDVPGDTIRAMKAAYSSWCGKPATLNKIARDFGISRADFDGIRRACGWTHDQSPYTREELEAKDTGDLLEDLSMRRERELELAFRARQEREREKDARAWREFQAGVWEPLLDHIVANPPRRKPFTLEKNPRPYKAVFAPWDLHLLKLGVDGAGLKETRELALETTERLLGQVATQGAPESLTLWLGSDMVNSDTPHGTTTRGTPQDDDGLPHRGIDAAFDLSVEMIDRLSAIAPLTVRVVSGNHDLRTCHALAKGLHVAYNVVARRDDVNVICDYAPHQAELYGNSAILATHGDGLKKSRSLSSILSTQWPEMWGRSRFRYALVGHLHHLKEIDQDGIHVLQLSSLANLDRYHHQHAYSLAQRGQVAFLFDRHHGMTARLQAMLPPPTHVRYHV